MNDRTYINEE